MKDFKKVLIVLFLHVVLSACSQNKISPIASKNTPSETITVANKPTIKATETFITTIVPMLPTPIPPTSTNVPPEIYKQRLDYAKVIFRNHYATLPYVDKEKSGYTLEYYGCVDSNDFGGLIAYRVNFPLKAVEDVFVEYLIENGWNIDETVNGIESNIETVTYKAHRTSTKDKPTLEKIVVILYNESRMFPNENYRITIRSTFRHYESTEKFNAVSDFGNCRLWFAFNTGW